MVIQMAEYRLIHPYETKPYKKVYKTLQEARASALKLIKKNYPKDGKHYVELIVMNGNKKIGRVNYGWKYRGRSLKSYEKTPYFKSQDNMDVLFENNYVNGKELDEFLYKLNLDGSLGQKYKISSKGYKKMN